MQNSNTIQTGNGQVSAINQVQLATATNFGNFAATNQTGVTSNMATVSQNDGSKGNRAYATQLDGNKNTAAINQNNSGGGTTKSTETAARARFVRMA